jgi:hypothetical protein
VRRTLISNVRIALANIRVPTTPDDSVRLATSAVADAGRQGAAAICFQECFVPGYRGFEKAQIREVWRMAWSRWVDDMRRAPCVVSVAEHTGWAHLVCVTVRGNVPAVIERRRVTLIDKGLPTLPYEHETTAMGEDEGNAVIARVRRSIAARTSDALRRVLIELAPAHTAVALAIREPRLTTFPQQSPL